MGNENKTEIKELSVLSVLEVLAPHARRIVRDHHIRVVWQQETVSNQGMKYSKKNPKTTLQFNKGYDLMQYEIVVRPYIIRKHGLENSLELDVLLYLHPYQFFGQKDLLQLPLKQHNYFTKTLIEKNFIEIVVKKKFHSANLYGLTDFAKKVVKDYYHTLSGRTLFNPESHTNPFRAKVKRKVDKIRENLMIKLTKQTLNAPKNFRDTYH